MKKLVYGSDNYISLDELIEDEFNEAVEHYGMDTNPVTIVDSMIEVIEDKLADDFLVSEYEMPMSWKRKVGDYVYENYR